MTNTIPPIIATDTPPTATTQVPLPVVGHEQNQATIGTALAFIVIGLVILRVTRRW